MKVQDNVLIASSFNIFIKQLEGYVHFICTDGFHYCTPVAKKSFELFIPKDIYF